MPLAHRLSFSSKFGKKITFIETLSELEEHAHVSQLHIPEPIKR
jgi:hypothetical protein